MGQVNQPSNLLDRIVALEREIAEVRKKVGLASATISSGGLTIQGGFLALNDPDEDQILWAGPLDPPRPDGRLQQAFVLRDDDGKARFWLWDQDPTTDGYRQGLVMTDYLGNRIFADDTYTGQGMALPWVPIPMYEMRYLDWPKTTNAAYEAIFEGRMLKQQPKIHLSFMHSSSVAGTTGNVKVVIDGIDVLISPVGFGVVVEHFDYAVSGDHLVHELKIDIHAQRTGGAGEIGVQVRYCSGRQS